MNNFESDADIERVAQRLIDRTLPKSDWTHAAHFAAALWMVKCRGPMAVCDMPSLIRAYNEATGVANTDTSGYHDTITRASLRAVNAWLEDHPTAPLHVALCGLLATSLGRSDWVLAHWSKAVLFSPLARMGWIEPDLQPLPFKDF